MWKRFIKLLCCPLCNNSMELCAFNERSMTIAEEYEIIARKHGVFDNDFVKYIDTGLILCHKCKKWFPIVRGLPVLVPYITPIHIQFSTDFSESISKLQLKYGFPDNNPRIGEKFVMESFSSEWLNYEYDGVIWGMSYEDHEKRFLSEVGLNTTEKKRVTFLEIGCGLGITTYFAHKNYEADAIGVDLSLAVIKATNYYKVNPFLHFVQASAFHLPFKRDMADVVYSHGVLHHSYSTYEAFKTIAPHCRPGGLLYIWVYGTGSKRGSILRRIGYLVEVIARPLISRHSSSPLSTVFLKLIALAYMPVNAFHRFRNPRIQKYNYKRALHAARDRFTPLYAHRQDYPEVSRWFEEEGFEEIQQVDWQTMPLADQDNYKRNTGIRGKRQSKRNF